MRCNTCACCVYMSCKPYVVRCSSSSKQEAQVLGCEPAQRLSVFANRALEDELLLLLQVSTALISTEVVAFLTSRLRFYTLASNANMLLPIGRRCHEKAEWTINSGCVMCTPAASGCAPRWYPQSQTSPHGWACIGPACGCGPALAPVTTPHQVVSLRVETWARALQAHAVDVQMPQTVLGQCQSPPHLTGWVPPDVDQEDVRSRSEVQSHPCRHQHTCSQTLVQICRILGLGIHCRVQGIPESMHRVQ